MATHETYFQGEDMARVINAMWPEMHDRFAELYPAVQRRITDIVANPSKPVSLRTADAIVTAMGCPHVLANGAVRVAEGYHRKSTPIPQPRPTNGHTIPVPDIMLPSPPFRKWLERQHRHYETLTSMYLDLDLPHRLGSGIWRGQIKVVRSLIVEEAAVRRGSHIEVIYPAFVR